MLLPSWLSRLRSSALRTQTDRRARCRRRVLPPGIELLEERCLLTSGLSAAIVGDLCGAEAGLGTEDRTLELENHDLLLGAVDAFYDAVRTEPLRAV